MYDMTTTLIERRYRMIRLRAGDYLLPANDGKTLWRIHRYTEDGSLEVSDGKRTWKVYGTFWACSKYERPFHGDLAMLADDDFLSSDHWLWWEGDHKTRDGAIQTALKSAERFA